MDTVPNCGLVTTEREGERRIERETSKERKGEMACRRVDRGQMLSCRRMKAPCGGSGGLKGAASTDQSLLWPDRGAPHYTH